MTPSFEQAHQRKFRPVDKGLVKVLSETGVNQINHELMNGPQHAPLLEAQAPVVLYSVINETLAYFTDTHGCRFAVKSDVDIFI